MSKLVLIKNIKTVRNKGESNEEIIRFDVCDLLDACLLYHYLDKQIDEKDYDVKLILTNVNLIVSFPFFDDARRLMEDLTFVLQNKDHHFVEFDLLNYETK